jgi:cystathionine beta-lyase/cystathionine gamma-synthase
MSEAGVRRDEPPRIDPQDELICLGHEENVEAQGGALAPPIVQTSLFAMPSLEELMAGFAGEHERPIYTRGNNPTVRAVEAKIARLERGEECRCLASGMAAISAVMLSRLRAGDHVLFVNQTYGPTLQLAQHLERFGIRHDLLLDLDPAAVEAALEPETRLLWLESPGTMLFRQLDLGAVAAIARERGVTSVVDNSWASPLFQKPLTLGVDMVVHSATKYIGGHSDVVAGAVVGGSEAMERLFYDALLLNGGVMAPFDAWLLNRGLRTLPVRMRRHHSNGLEVARFLASHPKVRQVFHPALVDAVSLPAGLCGYSGLLSAELDTDCFEDLARFVDGLDHFRIGVSWGGVESLAIVPFRGDNAEALSAQGIPLGLLRLSVGLEDPPVLIADLERALDRL